MTKENLLRELCLCRDLNTDFRRVKALAQQAERSPDPSGLGESFPGLDLQVCYQNALLRLLTAQCQTERLIEGLESRERCMMRYYYVQGYTWKQISEVMCCSVKTLYRTHKAALAHILEQMPE